VTPGKSGGGGAYPSGGAAGGEFRDGGAAEREKGRERGELTGGPRHSVRRRCH
jgi:hypothetical protein